MSFHDFIKEQIIRTIVLENVQTCLIDVAEKVLLLWQKQKLKRVSSFWNKQVNTLILYEIKFLKVR